MIDVGWFLLGLVALIAGAEVVVRKGVRVAAELGVPPLVIGLTIVAVGTSTPEMAIGISAARQGNGSLAVGNIAGANTLNILLTLGLSALLRSLALKLRTVRFDLPLMLAAAIALTAMAANGVISRLESWVLVAGAVAYTAAIIRVSKSESRATRTEYASQYADRHPGMDGKVIAFNFAALCVGIAVVVGGAGWLVDGAVGIARTLGVSDAVIGLTIVAIGTAAPELVTTIITTYHGAHRDIAIGNLIGSNIYNIVLILGIAALAAPGALAVAPELVRVDIPFMAAVALVCVPVFITGREVSRTEGALFVAAYAAYLTYLLIART